MKPKLVFAVLVACAAVILAVAAAEVILRFRAAPRGAIRFDNRLYPYVMFRPLESATYISAETFAMSHHQHRVHHYTNEDGFRVPSPDYKLPREKPAGQLRLAVLGASAVQLGSTYDTTLPGSLRRVLREKYPGRDIEVINAGVTSSVSRQSVVQFLLTVSAYHPDIVILYDGVNDIGLPITYESRPNFPYNFQTMEEAWDLYRRDYQEPLWKLALHRSYLYQGIRARLAGPVRLARTDSPAIGPNALPAQRVLQDQALVRQHIRAYLSNWTKLVELSEVYRFRPVCVLQPTGALEGDFAPALLVKEFRLTEEAARQWMAALSALYGEADRQIEALRATHPKAAFINLRDSLKPAEQHYWDLVHVYDETNLLIAERLFIEIKPLVEMRKRLPPVTSSASAIR